MLKIENKTVVFTSGYSLDHVITGYRYFDSESFYENAFSNLEFELSLIGYENIEDLGNYKFKIPANAVENLKEEYLSFRELINAFFEYKDNGYVFPYLSKDMAIQE